MLIYLDKTSSLLAYLGLAMFKGNTIYLQALKPLKLYITYAKIS